MNRLIERDQLIEEWLYEAAKISKKSFEQTISVEEKTTRTDLVTNIDKKIEQFFIEKISTYFPGERVLGEESSKYPFTDLKGTVWIIDPIDGTLNFVKQKSDFAIMIGIYENGIGYLGYVYDVMRDELYSAAKNQGAYLNGEQLERVEDIPLREGLVAISHRLMTNENSDEARRIGRASSGVRMIGSAGLETTRVATGKLVAYIGASLAPWDIAAGKIIAEELGLIYTQLNGEIIDMLCHNKTVVATPSAHKEIIKNFK
ncbi:myo-inositol-1(or 4)-monophosphatase [Carnobacterium iners]|uniref:Myo-inositol-1(Or 4)-monophosphatase n=1 Tax=Carnobacterium iners TaxID=1073423 RepID=A0A1X7NM92_9LACT|nr:inositol monophosphatase family protein [Carnobacterium iners]SEK70532.1 myo-inositol-1(or 4)-monophosphatase [Carnobacterium iners]SMH38630.1 myo-inositol-1(or 4)-monophosphatase [Carnobacterium iners]